MRIDDRLLDRLADQYRALPGHAQAAWGGFEPWLTARLRVASRRPHPPRPRDLAARAALLRRRFAECRRRCQEMTHG